MNEDLKWAIGLSKATVEENLCSVCLQRGALDAEDVGVLRFLITTAEQVLEAENELPQEKCGDKFQSYEDEKEERGFNEALSLCLPILAKKNLRIRELEEKYLNDKDEILATLSNLSSHGLDNTDCTEEEITYALNEVLKYFGEKLTWLEEVPNEPRHKH
jgi:hypothetical protein